ncbi:response regulator [Enhygromyxa salina]|nr:response regulator [Enhygromyxa salina]
MRKPKPPDNEQERLIALARYEILDTDPELPYDEVVRLAAHICGTPIALVSLVDDHRQWFKARVGLDAAQIPKEVAFCGHVVETGQRMIVEDARNDERFADNPLVVDEPRVIYYAGAPLETNDGFTLGSLCVIDHEPRTLSTEQLELLEALSRVVVRQLELRQAQRAREAAEVEAARAERVRRRFFEVSLDMLCVAGMDGYFQELNPAWTATLGWTNEELCARPFIDFVHPEDREATLAEAAALGQGDHITVQFENRYQTSSGDYRWLAWTTAPDLDHQVLLAVARDVTELKAREGELLAARKAADDANRAKSDFLAKMSHELRTPLNSVIGFTNILSKNKRGNLDAKELIYLDRIGKNGFHLLALINDLLDLSKIEAGQTVLDIVDVDAEQLLHAIHDELQGAIAAAGNTLEVVVPPGLEPFRADARRFKQILINLVGNANKFTSQGRIELRVVVDARDPTRVARIDVADSGIGIPVDQYDVVFEAFRQVSEGGARTYDGTGLGLAISRSLAELHDFELGFSSVVDVGTTFFIKIEPGAADAVHEPPRVHEPGSKRSGSASPRAAASSADGRTVLIIEDDNDARLLVSKAVTEIGARVVTADTAESGLAVANAVNPELIVLDLQLPDADGRDVIRRLSKHPRLRHVPVVIFSAYVDGASEGSRAAAVLEKPVDHEELVETIAAQLGPRRRVLVVDDDGDTREMLCVMLRDMGVETSEAANGLEALRSLHDHGADLMLLDICMPNMDGFEVLARVRADSDFAELPVVVCTALDPQDTEAHTQVSSAAAVLRKGSDLEGRLEQVISLVIGQEAPS